MLSAIWVTHRQSREENPPFAIGFTEASFDVSCFLRIFVFVFFIVRIDD
jgi:hypothetical protein